MVTSTFPRWKGDSTTPFVLHLACDLQALGWKVDVIAPHAPDAARCEEIDGVHVERFRYLWPEGAQTVCYQGGALINLRKSRANVLKLPALVAAELAAVTKRLARRRYDLVHSHWILPQGFVAALAAQATRTPHILTVHGSDIFGLRGSVLNSFKKYALRTADAVTVNSSATEAAVRRLVPQLRSLRRIPMGVSERAPDPNQVAALRRRFRRQEGPLLLFVGRLVMEKGLQDLLMAVASLRTSLPQVTALVIGEGQERAKFEMLSKRLRLEDCVTFLGWIPSAELGNYYAAADIFVGPSRTGPGGTVEAQGLTFLEAMMVGTPVIASRIGGIVDAIYADETGLLVDEQSPQQIATAVVRLQNNPSLKRRISTAGYALVRERFTRYASASAFSELLLAQLHCARGS